MQDVLFYDAVNRFQIRFDLSRFTGIDYTRTVHTLLTLYQTVPPDGLAHQIC